MCCLGMVDRQETSHNLQSAGGGRKAEDFGFLNSGRERNPNEVMDNRDRVRNVVDVGNYRQLQAISVWEKCCAFIMFRLLSLLR